MNNIFTKSLFALAVAAMGLTTTSCNDWLGEESPGSTKLEDYFTSGAAALQVVNGCYSPLQYEFNNTYFSEWFFGDIPSDDALKGGQNVADGADAYDMDNFKTNANNGICLDYYRAKYMGIARCNLALQELPESPVDDDMTESRRDCALGECYFLRAFYYFQLVKVFGGVPLVDFVVDSSEKWQQPRATLEECYAKIIDDLKQAESLLWEKSAYPSTDLGRATRGAALAMLCKVYLYMKDYDNAYTWGKKFIDEEYTKGEYSLCPVYYDNFTLAGENGPESVFEIQYMEDPTSDYGEGFGFTRGTFSTILMRPRLNSLSGSSRGWGWNHPTQDLYDEFEEGDPRREATIGVPPEDERNEAEINYLGSPYYNNKCCYSEGGTFPAISHDSRSPMNYPLVRASDVILLYGEAALESGKDLNAAKWALETVRNRARQGDTSILPAFPGYRGYSDNTESLRQAIRHERRVEMAMEGHRFFDLVRWGIAKQVLDKDNGSYGKNESAEARAEMANFIEGKNELFPIPAEEINLNPMDQNPGY
ncbi:MAG: RagB/SusD family nutrient uptake outer membrane protein [Bacteroidales bacterium]|nr:RagB/SusD family nutrient uptake outer membrane protein [Bacteroidales bacterium]